MMPLKQGLVAIVLLVALVALVALGASDASAQPNKPLEAPKEATKDPGKEAAKDTAKVPGKDTAKAPAKDTAKAPANNPPPAATETVTLTPFDLMAGTIPAPPGAKRANIVDGSCLLTGGVNGWTFNPAACQQLTAAATQTTLGPLTVVLAEAKTLTGTFAINADSVTLTTSPAVAAIALHLNGGWSRFDLKGATTKDPSVVAAFRSPPPDGILGLDATGAPRKLELSPERGDGPNNAPGTSQVQDCLARDDHTDAWCNRDGGTICIDATAGISAIWFGPKNHITIPNKSLNVLVRRRGDQGVVVSQQGKRGLYDPGVQHFTAGMLAQKAGQQSGGTPCDVVTPESLAPRQPGSADIKVQLRDLQDHAKVLDERTFELEVDTTYAGAIRLGFSTVFGRAVDRAYAAQTGPGSSTPEVASTERGDVNVEAVVSFSTYLFDLLVQGGRTYATRSIRSYLLPSPYIAVGLVTPNAGSSGLRAVPSLHLGVEWELSKSFSVGVDVVARKVTRLSDGFVIGAPVSADSIFTESRYEWGWSFTFTVSPDFFQFAVGKP